MVFPGYNSFAHFSSVVLFIITQCQHLPFPSTSNWGITVSFSSKSPLYDEEIHHKLVKTTSQKICWIFLYDISTMTSVYHTINILQLAQTRKMSSMTYHCFIFYATFWGNCLINGTVFSSYPALQMSVLFNQNMAQTPKKIWVINSKHGIFLEIL